MKTAAFFALERNLKDEAEFLLTSTWTLGRFTVIGQTFLTIANDSVISLVEWEAQKVESRSLSFARPASDIIARVVSSSVIEWLKH
jgi:hypothetical protein